MHRKNFLKKLLLYFFCVISLLSFTAGPVLNAQVDSEIEEKEEEKEEKEDELEESEGLEEAYLEEGLSLSQRIAEINKLLESLESKTNSKKEKLESAKKDLDSKKADLDDRERELSEVSSELYKYSFVNAFEVILTAEGTGDMIQKIGFLRYGMGGLLRQFKSLQKEAGELEGEYENLNKEFASLEKELAEIEEEKVALDNQKRIYEIKAASEAARQEDLKEDIASIVSDIENLSQEAQDAIDTKTGDGESPGGGDGVPGGGDSPQDPTGDAGKYDIYKDGQLAAGNVDGPVRLVPEGGSYFTVDSGAATYRGILEMRADTNVFIINELDIELYLRGIGEMYSYWPAEALKSQAVIARTYAAANWNKRLAHGYNLRDDTYDQNYIGYGKEAASYGERWVSAVHATGGEALYHGGNLITAYYHSTCGGHTLSSAQVWGGQRNFAQAKSDWYNSGNGLRSYDADSPWSYKRWCGSSSQSCTVNENINNTQLLDLLNAALYLSADPESSARQDEVRRPDLGGLSSQQIITRLGSGNTISDKVGNLIEVKSIYNGSTTSINQTSHRTIALRVIGSDGSLDIDAGSFWLTFNVRAPGSAHIFYSNFWTVVKEGASWNFYTRGYPHRVGLCQYGAKGRADAGQNYSQILSHYYNGAAISDYTPQSSIRIGLTRVGGASTYISCNGTFRVFAGGDEVASGDKSQSWKIVKK
jgi:stage II sporulation protein D